MSLGLGILLLVIGAILVYALDVQLDWIDLDLVGYILMAAGVVVIILGIALLVRRRRSSVTVSRGDAAVERDYDLAERRDDPQL